MKNLVSICIPTYNQEHFIEETLLSCLKQTYRPLEVIVLDDQSSDQTFHKTQTWTLKNIEPGIEWRISQNAQRKGVGDNWNTVANMAQGEFIKLLCGDDLIDPTCIEEQVKTLVKHAGLTLVTCQRRIVNSKGQALMTPIVAAYQNPTDIGQGLNQNWRSGTNLIGEPLCGLFRKSDFLKTKGYDGTLPYMIDLSLWIQLWQYGKIMRTPQVLGSFRIHSTSLTSQLKIKHFFEYLAFIKKSPQPVSIGTFLIAATNAFLKTIARNLFINWISAKRSS